MSILVRNVKILGSPKESEALEDVLITDETISAIGNFAGKRAAETIDGQGGYLMPGFIDLDTTSDHYLSILTDPTQASFVRQGVTTIIGGHCGASLAPLLYGSLEAIRKWGDPESVHVNWHTLSEFFENLSRRPLAVNFGTLAGHSTIRRALIGDEIRDLSENETKVFLGVLERALSEGAFGLSFGLESFHARDTSFKEFAALSAAAAKGNALVAVHPRGGNIEKSVSEIVKLQKETGAAIFINHFVPRIGEEEAYRAALEHLHDLPETADISFGVYPFAGRVIPLHEVLPEWARNGTLETMRKNVEDTWLGKRIQADLADLDPAQFTIENAPQEELRNRTLKDYMEFSGIGDPREGVLRLMRTTKLKAIISRKDLNAELLTESLFHPRARVTSHAASMPYAQSETIMALRAKRTMPEFLNRAEKKGSLREAVRKITAIPAAALGLTRRGSVEERFFADLVLWKDGEVKTVFVNGKIALRGGEVTGTRTGKLFKRA